ASVRPDRSSKSASTRRHPGSASRRAAPATARSIAKRSCPASARIEGVAPAPDRAVARLPMMPQLTAIVRHMVPSCLFTRGGEANRVKCPWCPLCRSVLKSSAMDPLIRDISDTARWMAVYRARETDRADALFRDPFARALAGERGEQIAKSMAFAEENSWPFVTRTYLFDKYIVR